MCGEEGGNVVDLGVEDYPAGRGRGVLGHCTGRELAEVKRSREGNCLLRRRFSAGDPLCVVEDGRKSG